MSRPLLLAVVLTLPLPSVAAAQHDGGGAPRAASTAPREATQFAFLLGQWELTVTPKSRHSRHASTVPPNCGGVEGLACL